ncbi:MAG: flagellar biosynthesis anti-sigma factor FlgM [Desulfobacterales bacterium]|jgi:negative regulator of flagellin synthesis FlgM
MEINGNQGIGIDAYVNQVQDKNKVDPPDKKPEKSAAKADTVVISDAAKRIQEARRQLDEIPDVRENKVTELRNQIQNGTYEINADKIAGKMIKESLLNDALK